jgi:hypothetical protein
MIDGFRVAGDVVAEHVTEVEALAERTGRAANAAQPLRRDAYGLLGQVFADTAEGASRTASHGVADLAAAVRRRGEGVRSSHAAYAAVDGGCAKQLRELR